MSAVNDGDDLLNYELGDDIDDQDICCDEDELLLSDEEMDKKTSSDIKQPSQDGSVTKLNKKHNDLKRSNSKNNTEDVSIHKYKKPEEVTSSACESEEVREDELPLKNISQGFSDDVSTSGESPPRIQISETIETNENSSNNEPLTINDEVSSTNKEIEEIPPEGVEKAIINEPNTDVIRSSQESISISGTETTDPREDDEETEERYNFKHTSERYEELQEYVPGTVPHPRFHHPKRGRGGGFIRGSGFQGPRQMVRYSHSQFNTFPPPNENVMALSGQFPIPYNPTNPQMNPVRPFNAHGRSPNGVRLEYRPTAIGNFRGPNDFPIFPSGPRPDFGQSGGLGHGNNMLFNNFSPQGQHRPMFRGETSSVHGARPRMPIPPRPIGMPPQPGNPSYRNGTGQSIGAPSHQASIPQIPVIRGPSPSASKQPAVQQVLPSKILINPNFKGGGLQAATNQLFKDSQFINVVSQVKSLQNDNELLRQQEEFIHKNREHIKRRHERSPPLLRGRSRSRSRERSYSPTKRDRARRANSREQYLGARGRFRRGNSREYDNRSNYSKKRRSCSISPDRRRERNNVDEEDEETRAYRIKIEKQKALREKFMREKEMRRRKAVETKLQHEEKTNTVEETSPTKLEPISVTNKIIRLKRDECNATNSVETMNSSDLQTTNRSQKSVSTGKVLPDDKKLMNDNVRDTATTQQQIKKSNAKKSQFIETDLGKRNNHLSHDDDNNEDDDVDDDDDDIHANDELLEEDRLLADTPSPPPPPKLKSPLRSTNRRIILKSSPKEKSKMSALMLDDNKKGIFDRLERKVGVKEADKRKIQRIVIKNAE